MVSSDKVPNTSEKKELDSLSIILTTQETETPLYQSPNGIKGFVPKNISYELILVHYNQDYINNTKKSIQESEIPKTTQIKPDQTRPIKEDQSRRTYVQGQFAQAVLKGIEMSSGRLILVIDADFPYPAETLRCIIEELINSNDFIIIASRYIKDSSLERLPFVRSTISKGARMIVKHGLKIKEVKDPLSSCFGLSRDHLKGIHIEGSGHEILLEILVKVTTKTVNKAITVKEIPFIQKGTPGMQKLDFDRILGYLKAVWHLYLYGRKFKQIKNPTEIYMKEKHKSVIFLSKAGRFLTVGASGLLVNYAVSLLMTYLIPNMWYIHATLIGILSSISTNFLLNKVWTFEDRDFSTRHIIKQYFLFLAFCSFGAVIQLTLISTFIDYYHIQYAISLVMAVAVASIGNFLLNKKITFGERIWE